MNFKNFLKKTNENMMIINDPFGTTQQYSNKLENEESSEKIELIKKIIEKDLFKLNLDIKQIDTTYEFVEDIDKFCLIYEIQLNINNNINNLNQLRRLLISIGWIYEFQQNDNLIYDLYKKGIKISLFMSEYNNPCIGVYI